jgi:hypothetical protein
MIDLCPAETKELDAKRLLAVGSFLWNDAKRILAVASRLRDAQETIVCQMQGGSMLTAIPYGSRIRIRFTHHESYSIGQVVAFLIGTKIMVHRVVYRGRYRGGGRDYLITLGDALLLPDPPVNMRSILGPVIELQYEGYWRSPGAPSRRPLLRRFVSFVLVRIVGGILEVDIRLAHWLATRLHSGSTLFARKLRPSQMH